METVIRYVRDIASGQRLWLEAEIGHQLQDDQRVVIQILAPGDAASVDPRRMAFDQLQQLSKQGARHREASGASEEEADAILNEALRHVRRRGAE